MFCTVSYHGQNVLPQVQVGDVVVACCVLSVASEQSHLLHFRERERQRGTHKGEGG